MNSTIQLQDICRCLGVSNRAARYVLEQGFVPQGIDRSPASGNHRRFDPAQALWLAMVLKLKEIGLKSSLAAKIADYAWLALRGVTQNLGWEWTFSPHKGRLGTVKEYFVEVAEYKYIRFGTSAHPASRGRITYFDWHVISKPGTPVKDLTPCVVVRLDVSQIARLLEKAL